MSCRFHTRASFSIRVWEPHPLHDVHPVVGRMYGASMSGVWKYHSKLSHFLTFVVGKWVWKVFPLVGKYLSFFSHFLLNQTRERIRKGHFSFFFTISCKPGRLWSENLLPLQTKVERIWKSINEIWSISSVILACYTYFWFVPNFFFRKKQLAHSCFRCSPNAIFSLQSSHKSKVNLKLCRLLG